MNGVHDPGELSAHALGLLDGPQARAVEQHLTECVACRQEWSELRETVAVLDSVPPETFLDGPPDNELVRRRTLHAIRREAGAGRTRRRLGLAVAAAVVAAALLGAGAFVGHQLTPPPTPVAASDARTLQGVRDGVSMSATLTPAPGWVRVAASVRGIPPGQRCTLLVLAADGSEHVAGSWLVGTPGPTPPAPVQGSAIVDPAQVVAVAVRNDAGRVFVTLPA